ncbi:hypothetical protein [Prolixibacter sp. NT017]|uniref:hypothetical protein n=1 Tax=Prolixibacter sp. NT017 TaxID=2652390 RepID=UPI0012992151|nr:hypothetical protein [Prolixibacter sp. NT017]
MSGNFFIFTQKVLHLRQESSSSFGGEKCFSFGRVCNDWLHQDKTTGSLSFSHTCQSRQTYQPEWRSLAGFLATHPIQIVFGNDAL